MAQQNMTLEMAVWIVEHGSEYLKALAKDGYPVLRQYIKERAKIDYPEFIPDINGKAEWLSLEDGDPSPTAEQIALARRYGGRAVFLCRTTQGSELYRGRVAVVIAKTENHLGVALVETAQN